MPDKKDNVVPINGRVVYETMDQFFADATPAEYDTIPFGKNDLLIGSLQAEELLQWQEEESELKEAEKDALTAGKTERVKQLKDQRREGGLRLICKSIVNSQHERIAILPDGSADPSHVAKLRKVRCNVTEPALKAILKHNGFTPPAEAAIKNV